MDPITLAAVTGGFAAVKSAISGVRSALESADDVSSIAGHIDTLFRTHGAAKKRIKEAEKKGLPKNKWAKFIKLTLKSDDNDETSLANVAAAKLAENSKKKTSAGYPFKLISVLVLGRGARFLRPKSRRK